jgi:dTDP-4-amino-4,6-dideoxy-D-galactose acyltransferase
VSNPLFPAPFEFLPWDTEAFGFGVARFGPLVPEAEKLRGLLENLARIHDVRLVYGFLDPNDAASRETVLEAGGFLADRRVIFCGVPTSETSLSSEICECGERVPTEAIDRLAILSGVYSRFRKDPRFPPPLFEALYRRWIARDLAECPPGVVYLAGSQGQPVGILTIRRTIDSAQVGLVGVSPEARGRGWGRALLRSGLAWAAQKGLPEFKVATQLDNQSACRLYEGAGLMVKERVDIYHFWVGDPT